MAYLRTSSAANVGADNDSGKRQRAEMIEPLIAQYRGRIVKLTGDGALCDFHSVVDAVACAILPDPAGHDRAGKE